MFSFITSFAITLPETAIPDILANVSGIFDDFLPISLLIIGVYVAFWILRAVIDTMRPQRAKESGWHHEFKEGKPTFRGRYYEEDEDFDEYDDDDDDDD